MKKKIEKVGIVRKISGDKTVQVECFVVKTHPLYEKKYQVKKTYLVDDPDKLVRAGEEVRIRECAPRSRHKRWEIVYNAKFKPQNAKS